MSESAELLIAAAQFLIALAALVVAVIAYRLTRQASRIEAHRTIKDAFNTINTIVLSDSANLAVFDALEFPELVDQSMDEKRRRWIGALMLNALESVFVGRRHGVLDRSYAASTLRALVPKFMRHDEVYQLLVSSGHDPEFTKYCQDVRESILKNR